MNRGNDAMELLIASIIIFHDNTRHWRLKHSHCFVEGGCNNQDDDNDGYVNLMEIMPN